MTEIYVFVSLVGEILPQGSPGRRRCHSQLFRCICYCCSLVGMWWQFPCTNYLEAMTLLESCPHRWGFWGRVGVQLVDEGSTEVALICCYLSFNWKLFNTSAEGNVDVAHLSWTEGHWFCDKLWRTFAEVSDEVRDHIFPTKPRRWGGGLTCARSLLWLLRRVVWEVWMIF